MVTYAATYAAEAKSHVAELIQVQATEAPPRKKPLKHLAIWSRKSTKSNSCNMEQKVNQKQLCPSKLATRI